MVPCISLAPASYIIGHHETSSRYIIVYPSALTEALFQLHPATNFKQATSYTHTKTPLQLGYLPSTPPSSTHAPITMFSCVNYERGCRGRCNAQLGRCDNCVVLNLQSSRTTSSSSITTKPSAAYSAMTSSFASLSQVNTASTKAQ